MLLSLEPGVRRELTERRDEGKAIRDFVDIMMSLELAS